ncbi:hypothetical protein OLP41_gp005 [Mycobacterium phage I3]|uniref:Uncharacterized protein n=1 Tax=Mycobacterium phage I3 TaxID=2994057 RepID=A0A8F2E7A7_9CAUD|nr:hypothetical protein OLP41_gp005 [Mycobacterium phage I3]QWT30292.1 hypothetical protein PBI_I3_5 [Mycobacterium phage I3]
MSDRARADWCTRCSTDAGTFTEENGELMHHIGASTHPAERLLATKVFPVVSDETKQALAILLGVSTNMIEGVFLRKVDVVVKTSPSTKVKRTLDLDRPRVGLMSDPAEEAAQRAMRKVHDYPRPNHDLIAAAREALKPIRELHYKVPDGRYPKCSTCEYDWPCATAYLIYTTEELEQ